VGTGLGYLDHGSLAVIDEAERAHRRQGWHGGSWEQSGLRGEDAPGCCLDRLAHVHAPRDLVDGEGPTASLSQGEVEGVAEEGVLGALGQNAYHDALGHQLGDQLSEEGPHVAREDLCPSGPLASGVDVNEGSIYGRQAQLSDDSRQR